MTLLAFGGFRLSLRWVSLLQSHSACSQFSRPGKMKPSPFEPFLSNTGFVVLDGGLATELEAQGANLKDHLWSARLLNDNPSLIRETHLAYYRAGADVAISASYQASFEGFGRKGFDRNRATELLLLSVKLAVEARDQFWQEYQQQQQQQLSCGIRHRQGNIIHEPESTAGLTHQRRKQRLRPLVAASLGCYGAALADGSEYRGDYGDSIGQKGLKEWHKERADVLAVADGIDLLVFETIPCLAEVRAIFSLLQDLRPSISAVISVSCKDDLHLRSGELVRDFADNIWGRAGGENTGGGGDTSGQPRAAAPACVVGVGVNCTAPHHVAGVLQILSDAAKSSTSKGDTTTACRGESGEDASSLGKLSLSKNGDNLTSPVLVAYPNSGEDWDATAKDWVEGTGFRGDAGVGKLGLMVTEWFEATGARVFGGCCRTRPAHITEIRRALSLHSGGTVPTTAS